MSKSIYSLVLSDEVISLVDKAAYRNGLSRSAMIDRILAKELSYETPEMRIKRIISEMESGLSDGVFFPLSSGGSVYNMRSALDYKYNPSLRYSIEISRDVGYNGEIGSLTVWLRSRSEELLLLLVGFFRIWEEAERKYNPGVRYYIDNDKKITRSLRLNDGQDLNADIDLGKTISNYINYLNSAVSAYFTADDAKTRIIDVSEICDKLYKTNNLII